MSDEAKNRGTSEATCVQCDATGQPLFCVDCCNREAWAGALATFERCAKMCDERGALRLAQEIREERLKYSHTVERVTNSAQDGDPWGDNFEGYPAPASTSAIPVTDGTWHATARTAPGIFDKHEALLQAFESPVSTSAAPPKTEVVGPLTARLRAIEDADDRPSDAQYQRALDLDDDLDLAQAHIRAALAFTEGRLVAPSRAETATNDLNAALGYIEEHRTNADRPDYPIREALEGLLANIKTHHDGECAGIHQRDCLDAIYEAAEIARHALPGQKRSDGT